MADQPRILNLDELPTVKSVMTIVHLGVEHPMQILSVEAFIDQEKRAEEHARMVEKALRAGEAGDDDAAKEFTQRRAVEIMKEAVQSFFPTLDVASLPMQKLLTIFAWLNDAGREINQAGAPEGNAPAAGEAA